MKNLIKNKKGYSLSGWIEGILFSILFVGIFAMIVGLMNVKYSQDNQIGLGGNTTQSALIQYQGTLHTQTAEGEASFTSTEGLTLKSSWGMITGIVNIVWDFITGGWIETVIISWMKLPSLVALIFRVLWFISLGLIILTILFKIKP